MKSVYGANGTYHMDELSMVPLLYVCFCMWTHTTQMCDGFFLIYPITTLLRRISSRTWKRTKFFPLPFHTPPSFLPLLFTDRLRASIYCFGLSSKDVSFINIYHIHRIHYQEYRHHNLDFFHILFIAIVIGAVAIQLILFCIIYIHKHLCEKRRKAHVPFLSNCDNDIQKKRYGTNKIIRLITIVVSVGEL